MTAAPAHHDRSRSTLRRLLHTAEKDVARLDGQRQRLEAEVSAAASDNDHAALRRLGDELSSVQGELTGAEERWLEVSEELDVR